ncbi:MAG: SRPBCC family protein [Deltaproteobacteria bacterium]|nr:SRPBCC family protein [Deltaproteobacteria bacterium]
MQQVEVTHRYDAPLEAVWAVYTDHARWSEWAGTPGARLAREGSPDKNGAGAVRAFVGGLREEILDFEPPKRMTYSVTAGLFPIKEHFGEVLFEPDGDGTRIVWRCRFESKIPGLGGLLQRFITWSFSKALAGLERHSFASG